MCVIRYLEASFLLTAERLLCRSWGARQLRRFRRTIWLFARHFKLQDRVQIRLSEESHSEYDFEEGELQCRASVDRGEDPEDNRSDDDGSVFASSFKPSSTRWGLPDPNPSSIFVHC